MSPQDTQLNTISCIFLPKINFNSLSGHSKRRPNIVFKTDYRLMQVKSIVEEYSAILSTCIKLSFVIKIVFCLFLSGCL